MSVVRVEVGPLVDADTDAIGRPIRSDGAALTPMSRQIELAAGSEVQRQLSALGELPPGTAVLTPGGALGSQYLLHLVLRSSEEPPTDPTVRRALEQGLARVRDWGLRSLTLPALGSGAGGLGTEETAALMADVLDEFGTPDLEVVVRVESEYEFEVFSRAFGDRGTA